MERIACTCADWLAHGREIVLQTPVLGVELTDAVIVQYPSGKWYAQYGEDHNYPWVGNNLFRKRDAEADMRRSCCFDALNWARTAAQLPRLEKVK